MCDGVLTRNMIIWQIRSNDRISGEIFSGEINLKASLFEFQIIHSRLQS